LKQAQFSPLPFEEQAVSIFAGTNGYLDSLPVDRVTAYEAAMLSHMRSEHADILKTIRESGDFSDESKAELAKALDAFAKQFA
jgi:F-type H+-transporting ATPase subunit alpha